MKHPIQPIITDKHGTHRFKGNAIVRHLLNNGGIDLNDIAVLDFTNEDREQFAMLIGYSLGGASELNYVSDETITAANLMKDKGMDEKDARIEALRDAIETVRKGLKIAAPAVFAIHPDDLSEDRTY